MIDYQTIIHFLYALLLNGIFSIAYNSHVPLSDTIMFKQLDQQVHTT